MQLKLHVTGKESHINRFNYYNHKMSLKLVAKRILICHINVCPLVDSQ